MGVEVTISLPVRNGQGTLDLALASLRAQTFVNWELLILDDGSQDRTVRIASEAARQDERVRFFHDGQWLGVETRLNQAVRLARAPLFARMDADDIAYPTRLERQVEFLTSNQDIDLVGSPMLVFGADEMPLGARVAPSSHDDICRRPTAGFPLFHPTWLGRTDWFRTYEYDPRAKRCEDQELLFRAYRSSRFANLPEILLGYREERLRLGPILSGRAHFARRVADHLGQDGKRISAAGAVGEQLLKGLVDTAAIGLGVERSILRHRARPLPAGESERWGQALGRVKAVAASSMTLGHVTAEG